MGTATETSSGATTVVALLDVKVLVPGVGWWVKFFDVEPRGEQKIVSNSPSVPLGGRQAWEPAGYCYIWYMVSVKDSMGEVMLEPVPTINRDTYKLTSFLTQSQC